MATSSPPQTDILSVKECLRNDFLGQATCFYRGGVSRDSRRPSAKMRQLMQVPYEFIVNGKSGYGVTRYAAFLDVLKQCTPEEVDLAKFRLRCYLYDYQLYIADVRRESVEHDLSEGAIRKRLNVL